MNSGVLTESLSLRRRLTSKVNQEWNLHNPHLWADEVLGRELYERHTRHKAKWLGWQDFQIAFMRDICDLQVPWVFGVCNRGGAKTMLTAYSTACLMDNLDNFRVNIVSGSFEQASIGYGYMRDCFTLTPMKKKLVGATTMKLSKFDNLSQVGVLSASEKRTRAPRSDMVIIDEASQAKTSILTSVLPQLITAIDFKLVVLTTPDKLVHISKDWWEEWEKLGIIRYHWDAYGCKWIPRANIERFRNVYDEATFLIEVMGEWASKTGNPFKYHHIQASLCDVADLPPMDKIDHFYAGIDWGDAHDTVITIMGMYGDVALGTDRWFIYDVRAWNRADMDVILFGDPLDENDGGIIGLCEFYEPHVLSEQSPISAYANRKLRNLLSDRGILMTSKSFTGRKHKMVNNLKGSFEKKRIKIPRRFRKTIDQLTKYHFKEVAGEITEEYEKKEDDYVDSAVWCRWGQHPEEGKIVIVGEM